MANKMKWYEVWDGNHSCGFYQAQNEQSAINKAENAFRYAIPNARAVLYGKETPESVDDLIEQCE